MIDLSTLPTFRVAACDLNGQMRGKRVPGSYADKLDQGAVRLPLSALNVDLWGADIEGSPLVFESGDADGALRPTERGPVPMPWLESPSALVPMWLDDTQGGPFAGDPRHALARVLARYAARGWRVMAATEMEFTLIDAADVAPAPPKHPHTGRRLGDSTILCLTQLDAFDGFFSDLYAACDAMGIPAQTALSESGVGQFEVTLTHQDAMRAADDAWLFKTLLRGLARKHGQEATFMAKPYPQDAGNGMHMHFSVVDAAGANVFDDGGAEGTPVLRHAVAGCLAAMPASTLIFAPYRNSYARLVPGAHAPISAAWGYDNRTVALRIPGGSPKARRIEHRVAGGDINPYLLFATVLGAAWIGIEDAMPAPAPITGNCYAMTGLPHLAPDLGAAIDSFETDAHIARIFPDLLIRNLVATKRQEHRLVAQIDPSDEWLSLADRA